MIHLSIITVNLNGGAGLSATAASIAAQLDPAVEWLVIDGGSSDGSERVGQTHGDLISFWQSRPDGGVYDAMNQGLMRARGRYVLFLNAGDCFAGPDVVGRLLARLVRPDAPDLLFGGTLLDFGSGRTLYRPPRPPPRYLRFGLPACHQATVIRRSVHARAPYDTGYAVTADYATIARLLTSGASWRCLEEPVAVRACSRRSLSERRWARRIREAARVQREILELPPAPRLFSLAHLLISHFGYVLIRDLTAGAPLAVAQRHLLDLEAACPGPARERDLARTDAARP